MMFRMVGGWVFLLVLAHPGGPRQRAVKRLLLLSESEDREPTKEVSLSKWWALQLLQFVMSTPSPLHCSCYWWSLLRVQGLLMAWLWLVVWFSTIEMSCVSTLLPLFDSRRFHIFKPNLTHMTWGDKVASAEFFCEWEIPWSTKSWFFAKISKFLFSIMGRFFHEVLGIVGAWDANVAVL